MTSSSMGSLKLKNMLLRVMFEHVGPLGTPWVRKSPGNTNLISVKSECVQRVG